MAHIHSGGPQSVRARARSELQALHQRPIMAVARKLILQDRRHWQFTGIEDRFVSLAQDRVRDAVPDDLCFLSVDRNTRRRTSWSATLEAGSADRKPEATHKRKTYGRKLPVKEGEQIRRVWCEGGDPMVRPSSLSRQFLMVIQAIASRVAHFRFQIEDVDLNDPAAMGRRASGAPNLAAL